MKAKICGLTETNQIETCIKYGASMCGFVMFYPQSHRNLSLDKAKELTSINNVKPNVAVLVNPSDSELNEIADLNFHYYQIYGDLKKEQIYEIKKRNGVKIINPWFDTRAKTINIFSRLFRFFIIIPQLNRVFCFIKYFIEYR